MSKIAKHLTTLRRGGGSNSKRGPRMPNPGAVYDFALRCAIRACLEQTTNEQAQLNVANARKEGHRHSVHLSNMGEKLGNLADKIATLDLKNDKKITRPFAQGLMKRLDNIRHGKDTSKSEYSDKRFQIIAKVVRDHVKQYRSTGESVNDIVIFFLRTSEAELKKMDPNPAVWFKDLDRYVARFAELLLIVLKEDAPQSATPELIESLNRSIMPTKQAQPKKKQVYDNLLDTLENFPMIQTVQQLFHISLQDHRQKLRELQHVCTEANFLIDLKKCINAVHTNQSFPGRREDFSTQLGYDNWQKREVKQLQELMKTTMLLNPNLSIANSGEQEFSSSLLSSRRGSDTNNNNRRSAYYGDDPLRNESGYTYIPNDPRLYFRTLMSMCVDLDTQISPESERAKTGVLSAASDELLRECWKTWRLSDPFRSVLYLELITQAIDNEILDIEYARDAMRSIDKSLKENEIANWTINDRETLVRVYEGLNVTCLTTLTKCISEYWLVQPEFIHEIVGILEKMYENPAYIEDHPRPLEPFHLLEETVAGAAVSRWRCLERKILDPQKDDMSNLMAMADKLCTELVKVAKRFKKPLAGVLHVPGIVMVRQMPFFILEMDNWAFLPETKNAPIEITFELYNKVLTLKRLYDQYGPAQKSALFKVESWFLLHVRRWLLSTYNATPEWVMNAIEQDEFKPINETTLNSSSNVDLFTIFHQSVDFISNLQWPNYLQQCRFNTALSKVIGIALQQYTKELEWLIRDDIYPNASIGSDELSGTFFDRAKYQLIGSRHHGHRSADEVPPDFLPRTCVLINNIEASRIKLDRLYQTMDVDDIAQEMRENPPVTPQEKLTDQNQNYLYSIKIVRAENLPPLDNNGLSDPYVVLEIDGKPITRTRTMYETLNPRWDQTFDIWLTEETVDVLALVYDEDVIGANEECGGVWFKLSPTYFDDYQTHELVLNLHPQGTLYLRIDMEGEKDDIQYWFAKAFRTLKRTENDAAGLIVDRMAQFFRACLNRKTLDKLLGRDRSFFSSFSRHSKHVDPTLQDCEDALIPIIDYLERNLKILNDNLSDTNMQLVVIRIWREILITLEGVLLPPLSEQLSDWKPLDDYEFHVVYKWLELLKILFNGGEDEDAVALDKLENSHYYALLSINAAYNLETEELMEGYHTSLKNQTDIKLRGGRKADRSKSVYHSKNTVRKRKPKEAPVRKAVLIDLPNSDTILRILRMRTGKKVKEFLHTEFEKRNHPQPQMNIRKDEMPPPPLPPHDSTPTVEQTIPLR